MVRAVITESSIEKSFPDEDPEGLLINTEELYTQVTSELYQWFIPDFDDSTALGG